VLSAVTVTNNLDIVNGDTSSIANLLASDGGDGIALREAIAAANNTAGADAIEFDAGLAGSTIYLMGTELDIADDLTLNGLGADQLAIDAQGASRVIAISNVGTSSISGVTLTGGKDDISGGGGLRNRAASSLTLSGVVIEGNETTGTSGGAGVWSAGSLTVIDSVVRNNRASVSSGRGGGVLSTGTLSVVRSTISGNTSHKGAGIYDPGGTVTITDSTISDNTATDHGGAVLSAGSLAITRSTVSGNTSGDGGAVVCVRGTIISYATIVNNTGGRGGGIFTGDSVTLINTIVANNSATVSGPNIDGTVTANWSLIEDTTDAMIIGANNITGSDPLLGPLADNGGPTMTHALLPGSPAIDAGDPAPVAPPYLDQRGYYRVVDGDGDMTARIDIGAFEFASIVAKPGDGNLDGVVDGLDYLLWAVNFADDPAGDPPGAPLNGDYNDDGVVDALDYDVWAMHFEPPVAVPAASPTVEPSVATSSHALATDTVIENEYDGGALEDNAVIGDWQLSRAMDRVFAKKRERGKF
jgi:hypothetical protein